MEKFLLYSLIITFPLLIIAFFTGIFVLAIPAILTQAYVEAKNASGYRKLQYGEYDI